MNRHFKDARYHLKRAAEHAKLGTKQTLSPVETKVREATGMEADEPEPSRNERLATGARSAALRARTTGRRLVDRARRRIDGFRRSRRKTSS